MTDAITYAENPSVVFSIYTVCSNHLRSTTPPHLHNSAVQNVIVIVVGLERQSLRYSCSQSKRQLNRGNQQSYFVISLLQYVDVTLANNNFATRINLCTMMPTLVVTPHGVRITWQSDGELIR